ncbi:DUF6308 family protein [Allobranchiibius sp. GilTou73]|uniref:DUF6308 family protein n=1 Tax=Allobranchiibius sp. GilTou73 TaxID=2904523 RepID=UPI001F2DB273|nr:DUF6308 family protein [Allobranchiibius sp. GilTou73]UIJ35314.1 DUF6308 family protein [Allobranchiibius sp. GilTou73]
MFHATDQGSVRQSALEIVSRPYAGALVAAYFDPDRGFAGDLFDGLDSEGLLADNPSDRFTVDDIAAASLLDVRFGPQAVRSLLRCDSIHEALSAVSASARLWDATPAELAQADNLWGLLRAIPSVGRTRATKLMARKRPHLIPIVDSVIAKALHLENETWSPLAFVLKEDQLRRDIDALRPEYVDSRISTLRLLDVLVWMANSRSGSAVLTQTQVGAPPARIVAGPGTK